MDFVDYMIFCFIALTILTTITCFLAWLSEWLMTKEWCMKWLEKYWDFLDEYDRKKK